MDDAAGSWTVVRVIVGQGNVDLAVDRLWSGGATAIEDQDGPTGPVLVAGYPSRQIADAMGATLRDSGFLDAEVRTVSDDGRDGWRPWAAPVRAGRFHLVPAWTDPPAVAEGEHLLLLDPGPTFGSGSHPTTRLCLVAIDRLLTDGASVIDVGCGSGVLAVAAAQAGAGRVVAIDIDVDAPGVTRANAKRNGVAERVMASWRPLAEATSTNGPFDLVAANLLAPVFEDLGEDLVAAVGPGGHLVAGGLLADRWKRTARRLTPLDVIQIDEEDGWATLTLAAPQRPR